MLKADYANTQFACVNYLISLALMQKDELSRSTGLSLILILPMETLSVNLHT